MRIEAEALEELVSSLRRRVGVVGIDVGGSFARGEAGASSDLDILVLTDAGEPSRVEAFRYAGRPTEALFMRANTLQIALDNARQGAQTVATWAGRASYTTRMNG